MANKFEIIGGALVVTNTISGIVKVDRPKVDLYYDTKRLSKGEIVIHEKVGANRPYLLIHDSTLADSVDSTLTPFTESTFRLFCRENLGFSTASGGSGAPKWKFTADNFTDLTTVVAPTANEGELAYVFNPQGVWLINRKPEGVYHYESGVWTYGSQDLQDRISATDELSEILAIGNTTGANDISISNGQVLKAESGSSSLNMRYLGVDGNVKFEGNDVELFWDGNKFVVNAGDTASDVAVSSLELNPDFSSITLLKSDFTRFGDIGIIENSTGDESTINLPNYPSISSAQNATIKQNVINSDVTGKDIIMKTDSTRYLNQLAYNTGTAGELIVSHTPSATNRAIMWPDKSGTPALTSDLLQERMIVTQANVLTTLGGVIDSAKEYFLDGIIDCTGITIEIPSDGIYISGYNFDISGLICSNNNYTLFSSPVGGSGNVLFSDFFIDIPGANSKVYDLKSVSGFEAIEVNRINWNNCTSLGVIDNYRQGLETGTGRFGGTPELELKGVWVGGYFIDTSIVRSLDNGAYSLYKAGAGFSMASRFRSNQNIDLPALASFIDFAPANFPNPSTLQLDGCLITRNGAFDSSDSNITPNITNSDLPSSWAGNKGIPNTFVGGQSIISVEAITTITTAGVFEDITGTFITSDLQHFDSPASGQLRHLGNDPQEFKVSGQYVVSSTANDEVDLKVVIYRDATTSFEDGKITRRVIDRLQGARNVAYFVLLDNITLNQNDYVKIQVANVTSTDDITAELDSFFIVEQR